MDGGVRCVCAGSRVPLPYLSRPRIWGYSSIKNMSQNAISSRGTPVRLSVLCSLASAVILFCASDIYGAPRLPSVRGTAGSKSSQSGWGNTLSSWFGDSKWFKKLSESKLFKSTRKTFRDMSFDELKVARTNHKQHSDTYVKYTERMMTLCDEAAARAELLLELADGTRVLGKLDIAAARYTEFSQFYPGHAQTEYALYRAIDCSFKRTRSFDRDQSKTMDTIELANTFLERQAFETHRADVEQVRTACYERLIASELNVCDFYLKANKMHAVERRLETVRTTMLKFAPEMEKEVDSMASRLPGGGELSTDISHSPLVRVATGKKDKELQERALGTDTAVKVAQATQRK